MKERILLSMLCIGLACSTSDLNASRRAMEKVGFFGTCGAIAATTLKTALLDQNNLVDTCTATAAAISACKTGLGELNKQRVNYFLPICSSVGAVIGYGAHIGYNLLIGDYLEAAASSAPFIFSVIASVGYTKSCLKARDIKNNYSLPWTD
ncbi:hypothetical protein FACS189472_17200 [Alphaproteobacteria bacterium]|nr:hypothetical protein FACS189472_17200 [Alphaproteobacteria bacterium]